MLPGVGTEIERARYSEVLLPVDANDSLGEIPRNRVSPIASCPFDREKKLNARGKTMRYARNRLSTELALEIGEGKGRDGETSDDFTRGGCRRPRGHCRGLEFMWIR